MFDLADFGFTALWNPNMIIFVFILGGLYFLMIGPFRKDIPDAEPVSPRQPILFALGLILLYIGIGSPLYLMSHILFSFHMVKMVVVYLMVPPLLILGTPTWLLQIMLKPKPIRKAFNFFTRSFVSVVFFNALFSFYHIPLIFDTLSTDQFLEAVYGVILFIASIIMWWPILSPLPDQEKLSDLKKIAYIFIDGALLTPACALIIFSDSALYKTYTDPEIWAKTIGFCLPSDSNLNMDLIVSQYFNFMPPQQDQQLGGVLMKVLQEFIYGSILAYVFFRWVKKEKKKDTIDSLDPVH